MKKQIKANGYETNVKKGLKLSRTIVFLCKNRQATHLTYKRTLPLGVQLENANKFWKGVPYVLLIANTERNSQKISNLGLYRSISTHFIAQSL